MHEAVRKVHLAYSSQNSELTLHGCAHPCNQLFGDRCKRISSLRSAQAKLARPYLRNTDKTKGLECG
jgi:hypothetical protein